jgi:hypothetical protein
MLILWFDPRPVFLFNPFVNDRETDLETSLSRLGAKTYVPFMSVHNYPVAYT